MESSVTYHIGIETGGTTCKVGILQSPISSHNIIASEVIHTRDPEATVADICAFFNKHEYTYSSMGVAAFGPICLDKKDPLYGYVTTTPKEHWANFPILPKLLAGIKNQAPGMKVAFDTDVNMVALFENLRTGKTQNIAYITVGTGIGVGIVVNGQMVHGLIHPEGGHIRVPILPADADFKGVCPFHGSCLEGLCTNVSIAKRFGHHVDDNVNIKDEDAVWDRVGYYLGQCCANLILFLSLEKIIIGGGVMNRTILYPLIQKHCKEALNGYISHPHLTSVEGLAKVIVKPEIEKDLGIIAAAVVGEGSQDTA